jgi:hypothetical protein
MMRPHLACLPLAWRYPSPHRSIHERRRQGLRSPPSDRQEAVTVHDRHSKGFDAAAFCKTYELVKPFIPAALKLIEAVPVYGPKIGRLLRFVCKIADALCASS